jgi:hypothetical protein
MDHYFHPLSDGMLKSDFLSSIIFSLAPDDSQPGGPDEFECIVTAAAVEGEHVNTATATGYYGGQTYTAEDDAHYFGQVQ